MPLIVKEVSDKHFEPAPPGLHQAVCVDVVDMGMVDGKFGPKHKVKLVFQLKAKNKLGERYQVRSSYTASLMEGSNLRRDLESWRGRSFTPADLKAFDLEKLLGVNCQINVKHAISKSTNRPYAQAAAILPAVKGEKLTPEKYEREPWPQQKAEPVEVEPEPDSFDPLDPGADSTVPFVALLAPLVGLLGLFA